MSIEFVPFHEGLLPGAAELLAARHARDRARLPLLPARFEAVKSALAAVRDVWHKPQSSGMAAIRDGRLVAYLIGEARFDTLRGRHAWIHLAGHATAADELPDLYGPLYAAVGTEWLKLGVYDHYVMMPANDRVGLDVWFSLSFGKQQAHAMRSLADPLPDPVDIPGVRFRRATEDDRDAMVEEMSPILRQRLVEAPVWAAALPENARPMREGFADLLADQGVHVWLAVAESGAEGAERVLGYQAYEPATPADDDLLIPISGKTVLLEVAATRPEARGRGIGRGLTSVGLADAAAGGYTTCVTDWRTTNLEANRFWPRMGFHTAVYRLTRAVDPRIAWATH